MKYVKYLLLLALCLALTACGPKGAAGSGVQSGSASQPGSASSASQSEGDIPQVPPDDPEPAGPDSSTGGDAPLAPLTEEDKAAAYDAACDYYLGTVFEVHSLTEITPREGEITFQVSCSKGGVKVEPDRIISLERKNGTWSVVNEGY